ncbi:uncharacterized protein OCT59_018570 [Rhizophagus irregularis]|uniref:Uncharacterized protein n=4 Tax=Rhizophagus irregularis TaxID=588596 RepID=A0A2P4PK03_RHIID|nr:hypothetical protein GLOIN_2v1664386 [Rhizophagus irregularis DAOM 181602=DAOM 197198]POG65667.1 hypothetical protein GLOIN_2v1664386 [Rhizophagus irregularis DAOM 181602=DAOM 197198]UZO26332.1 hypothetical protein OCT59_018570 [Rhizophagus irregularis]|eukprot:XP_025172533.1 hypothetical protein GLOIN_2v1664386 [Rhizophagus irregularis DAOM 181602=DAOM 197198]
MNNNITTMNHFSLAYDTYSKYINEFFESSKLILDDYLDSFLESSDHIYLIIMNNYFNGFLKYSNHILRVITNDSDLNKISVILITLVTVVLMACLSWYYTNSKNNVKTSNIDGKTEFIFVLEEEFNNSTTSTEKDDNLTEISRVPFQEKIGEHGPINKSLETSFASLQEESDFTIKYLQESRQEQDVVKIKESEILSQEDASMRLNDSTEIKTEPVNQEKSHEEIFHSDSHEPDANLRSNDSTELLTDQEKSHEEVLQSNSHEPDASDASVRPNQEKFHEEVLQSNSYEPGARPEDYMELKTETVNQEKFNEVVLQSNIHEPEASLQSDYEEISYEEIEESLYQESDENPLANAPNTIIQEKSEASAQYQSYEEISNESDDNPLANGSDKVTLQEPETSLQYKIQQILSRIPKADSPITQTGLNYTFTPKTESESEVSSQSDLSDIEETKYEDAYVQTDLRGSRSIILNDQIPVKVPLPNETALDVLDEFRLSNVVYAFSGQDLIEFEDYDEEEEIRRFLFKKNI